MQKVTRTVYTQDGKVWYQDVHESMADALYQADPFTYTPAGYTVGKGINREIARLVLTGYWA